MEHVFMENVELARVTMTSQATLGKKNEADSLE